MEVYFAFDDEAGASERETLPAALVADMEQKGLIYAPDDAPDTRYTFIGKGQEAWTRMLEWKHADLAQRILDEIDLVQLVSTFNPDEPGYGQPYAFDEPFRALIREAQAQITLENEDL